MLRRLVLASLLTVWRTVGQEDTLEADRQDDRLVRQQCIAGCLGLRGGREACSYDRDKPSKVTVDPDRTFRVVCYIGYAQNRSVPRTVRQLTAEDVPRGSCSHVVVNHHVALDNNSLTMEMTDDGLPLLASRLRSRGVLPLVALGGWSESAGPKYSRLAGSPAARANFVARTLDFVQTRGLSGIELQWMYPVCWQTDCKAGPRSDKANFLLLLSELSTALRPRGLLLAVYMPVNTKTLDLAFDVAAMSPLVDWLSVSSTEYFGSWDSSVNLVAPIRSVADSMQLFLAKGAPPAKLLLGLAFHGAAFTLKSAAATKPGSPVGAKGRPGPFSRKPGTLAFFELCHVVRTENWTVVADRKKGQYAFKGDQWTSYDDFELLQTKVAYARRAGFGGVNLWTLDEDDLTARCGCGALPLLAAVTGTSGSQNCL